MKRKSWVLFLVVGFFVLFGGVLLFTAWNRCPTVGLMGNVEQASITNLRFVDGAPAGDMIKVTIKNTGVSVVTICEGYVNSVRASNISPTGQGILKGFSQELTLTYPNGTLVYGDQYAVKVVTVRGNIMVLSLEYNSTSASAYEAFADGVVPTPIPLPASELTPAIKLSHFQSIVLFATTIATTIAVVGACFLANYALRPKNKKELFVLVFFVTIIIVFATIAVVFQVLFPPQIGLMVTLFQG